MKSRNYIDHILWLNKIKVTVSNRKINLTMSLYLEIKTNLQRKENNIKVKILIIPNVN